MTIIEASVAARKPVVKRLFHQTVGTEPILYGDILHPRIIERVLKTSHADRAVHNTVLDIRRRVEHIDRYREVKERAGHEIQDLPGDLVSRMLRKSAKFIDALPTGHSKGHLSRDLIHLTEVMQDPLTQQYDDVEILVGVLGGIFHDIGNSIVHRTDERNRLGYHAEAGAWYAGEEFRYMLPPNLLLLTQLAIAAHTKFKDETEVYRDGQFIGTRKPYDTKVQVIQETHDKRGLALTRAACRTDIIASILVAKHIPLAMNVDNLFLATGQLRSAGDMSAEENVRDLFSRDMSNPGAMLPYFDAIYVNAKDPSNWHNEDDTPFLTNDIFGPNADDLHLFVNTVLNQPPSDIDVQAEVDRFFSLCYLLEPGIDAYEVIEKSRRGFKTLPPTEQKHWAVGFKFLAEVLYPRYYNRMRINANSVPAFVNGRASNIQEIVSDVHDRAGKVLDAIHPTYLDGKTSDFPDITEALAA